jgi:hypothetical protein
MENIKVGDWVVDRSGDYCQVIKIGYMQDQDENVNIAFIEWIGENHFNLFKKFSQQYKEKSHDQDDIYGNWISKNNPDIKKRGFISVEREDIVGAYPTEAVAQIHASVQSEEYLKDE